MKLPDNPLFPKRPKPPAAAVQSPAQSITAAAPATATEAVNILIVDADSATTGLIRAAASSKKEPHIRQATSLDAAHAEMLRKPADILLVNLQIGDNAGPDLIRNLKRRHPRTDIIALSRSSQSAACLDAFRAGAADLLIAPWQPQDLQRAFTDAALRLAETDRTAQRQQRLRTACRRLNKARHEISQQVDLLCNDLVRAYQDMAQQLNQTQTAVDCAQALSGEVDVEGILRRTMEWVLKKLGPVNAAIYLPSGEEHFALGAYLNLDTQADAPLIETLGRTIVQHAREGNAGAAPLAINDDPTLEDLFGHDAHGLLGRQWLAIGCHTRRECLAVLLVFRTKTETDLPNIAAQGLLEAAAPILAERIEQALGLYRRMHPFPEDESNDDPDAQSDCPS